MENTTEEDYPQLARDLFNRGLEVIPIPSRTKQCLIKGWPTMVPPVNKWPDKHGIGIRTGSFVAIDIDILDPAIVTTLVGYLRQHRPVITRVGQPPKTLVPCYCPGVDSKIKSFGYRDSNGTINQIEILSQGQMFVAYGIHPDTKEPYHWDGDLLTHELPTIPVHVIQNLFSLFYDLAERWGWELIQHKPPKDTKVLNVSKRRPGDPKRPGDVFNEHISIDKALEKYDWQHHSGNKWTRPGKRVADGSSGSVIQNRALYVFSSNAAPLEEGKVYNPFDLYTHYEHGGDYTIAAAAVRKKGVE